MSIGIGDDIIKKIRLFFLKANDLFKGESIEDNFSEVITDESGFFEKVKKLIFFVKEIKFF